MLTAFLNSKEKAKANPNMVCFTAIDDKETHFTSLQNWYNYEIQTFYDNFQSIYTHFDQACLTAHIKACAVHGPRAMMLQKDKANQLNVDPIFPMVFDQFVKMMMPRPANDQGPMARPKHF